MCVHLHTHTEFSFLDGASLDDLVRRAAELEMPALAITDHNGVSAAVRFYEAAMAAGIKPIQGCELTFAGFNDGRPYHLTLLATGPEGYKNLCHVLSRAHLEHRRGEPLAAPEYLEGHTEGLIALSGCRLGELPELLLRGRREEAAGAAERYVALFGRENFFIELQMLRLPRDRALSDALCQLAEHLGVEAVATNNVHFARSAQFPLHDLLTCVRTRTRLQDVHVARRLNGENYLKSRQEMAGLFADRPRALAMTREIAGRCEPVIVPGRQLFPRFPVPEGITAAAQLRERTYTGALHRYGRLNRRTRERLDYELDVITRLAVEDYFLTVLDILEHARSQGIRFCGRGSSANSAVSYALGLTDVDPVGRGLLFERFLSLERASFPDIDIDFEAGRREEVMDYVFKRYGQGHVAAVCTFATYKARSVIRDFGAALGFPADEIDRLAKRFPHVHADALEDALTAYPELRHSGLDFTRYRQLFNLARQAAGFPTHVGTHLGGIVICREPIATVSPLQMAAKGVPLLQFDKRDVESLGLLKLDLLSLRTLGAVQTTLGTLAREGQALDYDRIPFDDPETYQMIAEGNTVGVFQLESSAQRSLQTRLNAQRIEDLVAAVALIRPGPVKAEMVEPYLRRRQGLEPITYADPHLQPILAQTYGLILFQEQVLQVASTVAGFTPGEADQLRRAMSDCRSEREMRKVAELFMEKALARGFPKDVVETVCAQISAYAGYGFCQGHAESFAGTAYKTAFMMRHHTAHYLAALMSHQPLGFYPVGTLVRRGQTPWDRRVVPRRQPYTGGLCGRDNRKPSGHSPGAWAGAWPWAGGG